METYHITIQYPPDVDAVGRKQDVVLMVDNSRESWSFIITTEQARKLLYGLLRALNGSQRQD